MITFIDKYGVSDAIHRAGHSLREENGQFVSSDDVAVQAIIDAYTLDDAKRHKCAEIDAFAKWLRDKYVKGISPGEMSVWATKLKEAQNYPDCPTLDAEAQIRGVETSVLVAKVIANAESYSAFEGGVSGICGKHKDAVKQCATFESVAAYDFSSDWPVI